MPSLPPRYRPPHLGTKRQVDRDRQVGWRAAAAAGRAGADEREVVEPDARVQGPQARVAGHAEGRQAGRAGAGLRRHRSGH